MSKVLSYTAAINIAALRKYGLKSKNKKSYFPELVYVLSNVLLGEPQGSYPGAVTQNKRLN